MGQIRQYCAGCGEEWPCWYSQNLKSYNPATIGIHAPTDKPSMSVDEIRAALDILIGYDKEQL